MQKQKALFVTFDLIRPGDPPKSLAIASILAALKNCGGLKRSHVFEHLPINVFAGEKWQDKVKPFKFSEYSYIAVSAYVWGERYLNDLLAYVRNNGFGGKIILGGYQIANDTPENYKRRYPAADIFIDGFAERKLLEIFSGETAEHCCSRETVSPYLTGEIEISRGMPMVRFETKRGCPYCCTFCRHRDVIGNAVTEHGRERVMDELDFIISAGVKKVNVVDPIFHVGKNYMDYLSKIISSCKIHKSDTLFSLQCRLEFLAGGRGREFLDLCKRGNIELEFGLQTCDERESVLIKRKNNIDEIEIALEMLNASGVTHEISLIYGLPGQTLDSFARSVNFVKRRSNATLKAFPLGLLRGTPLFNEKEKYGFEEEPDEYGIPHVVSSSSFTYGDYLKMRDIAENCADVIRKVA